MLGYVGSGIGYDAGDADYYAGLGMDAGDTTDDAFEGTIGDLYHAAGAVMYLVVSDGIRLWYAAFYYADEVVHRCMWDSEWGGGVLCAIVVGELYLAKFFLFYYTNYIIVGGAYEE